MKAILDAEAIDRAVKRIAHEILERNRGAHDLILIGIQTRGVELARRLGTFIADVEKIEVPVQTLDVTLYRDDIGQGPGKTPAETNITEDIEGKTIVLVDDVLFTGRSARAALDALMDLGRPSRIQLAVLVDRGHRELPIRADFVGKNLPTAQTERVSVKIRPIDPADAVVIETDG